MCFLFAQLPFEVLVVRNVCLPVKVFGATAEFDFLVLAVYPGGSTVPCGALSEFAIWRCRFRACAGGH